MPNPAARRDIPYYRALTARDSRFDGVFYVGVTSTGIYCRPICPVKTPKEANCRFFTSAHAAEKESFRPCLRCRPELAPGNAPLDDAQRIAHLIAQRMEDGEIDAGGLETIAAQFELSTRQIRRIVQKEMGVSPMEFMQSRRFLLAKQLLSETALPITQIAFASGFSSLRRFNDAFLNRYRMPPTRLRKKILGDGEAFVQSETSTVQLVYRPPYDWEGLLAFLKARAMQGTESVTDNSYSRTVRIGKHQGWISVRHDPASRALLVQFTHALTPVLPALLSRLRNLFDLSARPDLIAAHLKKDKGLRKSVTANPGLRVPGAFDVFEMAVRAVLGQQVTVKAATTLAGRFAEAFGERIATPIPDLMRLTPTAERVARARVSDIAKLGIIAARATSIISLAEAYSTGALRLDASMNPDMAIAQLVKIPGIGPWTAHYIAMRALRWPDAFPKEDITIQKNLGGVTAKRADELSQAWRPWRSYAVLHIWRMPTSST